MAFTVLSKRSSVPGKAPTVAQLSLGELSINTNDGLLYFVRQNSTTFANTIVCIGPVPQTANALTSAVTLSLTGAVTGSTSYNGATNATIASTLASVVTAGTYSSIGVSSTGLALNGSNPYLTGTYVPLAGGTVSGNLTVPTVVSSTSTTINGFLSTNGPSFNVTVSGGNASYNMISNVVGSNSSAYVGLYGNATTNRVVQFLNSTTVQWGIGTDTTAETGSSTGSNFQITAYNNTGGATQALTANRATGLVTIGSLNATNATITTLTLPTTSIALTSAVTGSATFSGNAISIATTLPTTGVAAGTYISAGVNAQGFVTSGTNSPYRTILTSALNLYVSPSGNDTSGNGTSGSPWATMQKAWNTIITNYDTAGYSITVNCADGTYTAGLIASGFPIGAGTVTFLGNTATPTSCVVAMSSGAHNFLCQNAGTLSVGGFSLSNSAGGSGVVAYQQAIINIVGSMNYGVFSGGGYHIYALFNGQINNSANYTINGGAAYHLAANYGSFINTSLANATYGGATSCTITTTPSFSGAFALSSLNSYVFAATNYIGAINSASANAAINYNSTVEARGHIFPQGSGAYTTYGGQYVF